MQYIVFADSAGWPGLRGYVLQPMANAPCKTRDADHTLAVYQRFLSRTKLVF